MSGRKGFSLPIRLVLALLVGTVIVALLAFLLERQTSDFVDFGLSQLKLSVAGVMALEQRS